VSSNDAGTGESFTIYGCETKLIELQKVKNAKGRAKAAIVDVKPEIEATEVKVENEEEFPVSKKSLLLIKLT
jgi:hypothetical protein